MRVLFDTNVVLDVLIDRAPFAEPAARLFACVEHGSLSGCLGATTVTRDVDGFRDARLAVFTPARLLRAMAAL